LAKGARVVIAGRRSTAVEELRKTGGGVTGSPRMSARRRGALQTLHRALDALGGLGILVNNACGVRAEQLEAEIEAMLTMDLLTPILLTRAAPWITERRRSSATPLAITGSQ
jgi:NAD(P)-dependent dehydrogenase (short-subunit alcohol dehydrogenase family)